MKAIFATKYGPPDLLELKEVDQPVPFKDEILIRVRASSINAFDWRTLRADPFFIRFMSGLTKPKNPILGADVAGTIEAVGSEVTQFQVGDEVFADTSASGGGSFAEFVTTPEKFVAGKPANLSFDEAAAIPLAAVTALQGLRDKGQIRREQKVLINGASGGVGLYAVQIAKAFEAHVTAVCSSSKIEIVRSLGADHIIDYTKEDFTRMDDRYDLIFAANGNRSMFDYRRAVAPGGIFVLGGGGMKQFFSFVFWGPLLSMFGGKKMVNYVAQPNRSDLNFLRKLIEAQKIRPVIDRRYTLDEVPDALRYVESGHAAGKVVITV